MCGKIRGRQVAEWLKARQNPISEYENDVCIYIKKFPRVFSNKQYLDIIDRWKYIEKLKQFPELNVIAVSKLAFSYLSNKLRNKIVLIPHHHCNFERFQRPKRDIKIAGFCGSRGAFSPYENEFREKLSKIGLDLNVCYNYTSRQHVIDFYKLIDIQIIWRDQKARSQNLKNPLKISNAGSFGIPTISKPEEFSVIEYKDCFLSAIGIDEACGYAEQLKRDDKLYNDLSKKVLERSEDYHISNIANLYKQLEL